MQSGAPVGEGGSQGAKLVAMGEEPGAGRGVPEGGQWATGGWGRWGEVESGAEAGGVKDQ